MTRRTESIIKYALLIIVTLLFLAYEVAQGNEYYQQLMEDYQEQMQYQQQNLPE